MRRFSRLAPYVAAMLLGWIGISVSSPAAAQAGCTSIGTMLICEGNHSGGIELLNTPFELLRVQSLSTGITTSAVPGIRFYSTAGGQMAVMSETAPFDIATTGDDAPGIWVDSFVNRINSVASFQSGNVAVSSNDNITTTGDFSYGIVADAVTGIAHSTQDVDSRGGNILVVSYGSVLTRGSGANGVDVFNSITASSSAPGGAAEAWAGDVRVNARDIQTFGLAAMGISVRHNLSSNASGDAVSRGGSIAINNAGIVSTRGQSGAGLLASSSIWSTGTNAFAVGPQISVTSRSVETGADGARGILALATATATSSGGGSAHSLIQDLSIESDDVATSGGDASGIEALMEAYSDGTSSVSSTHQGITVTSNGLISTQGADAAGIKSNAVAEALSATGSATGTIGTTRVDNNGTIATRGDSAFGIVIEQNATGESAGAGAADVSIGSIIVNSRDIRTSGASSHGIFVDSYAAAESTGFSAVSTGAITINSHDLRTMGAGASGISVRSEVESYGTTVSADAADIVVTSTGALSATGVDANGIIAESSVLSGGANAGDISINILSGSVTGGSGTGAGIALVNGNTNTITNYGTVSALSGTAILGAGGDTTVNNYGRVIGDVNLFGGTQAFNNHASGVFETGDLVALGFGSLTNAGVLSPGGADSFRHTSIISSGFEQTGRGRYVVDLDFETGGSDYVLVMPGSGPVSLGGLVVPNVVEAGGAVRQFLILSAADGVIDNGLSVEDTAIVDYSVTFDQGINGVYLSAALDFAPGGLNPNQTKIGRYLNAAVGMDNGFEVEDLLNLATVAEVAAAYDQLSPEVFGHIQGANLFAAVQFSNELMSCREAGGPNAAIREGQCLWARVRATDLDVAATSANTGYDSRTGSFSAGLQVAMAEDWRLGVGGGYDLVSTQTTSGADIEGERANIGAVVKYNPGPVLFAAGVAAGWGDFDTDRRIAIGGFAGTATSNSDTDYVTGWLHAAYLAEGGGWYLKPLVDLRLMEIDFSGAREAGVGGAGLAVLGSSETVFSVSPAVEIGTEFRFDALSVWRPFLRAGVTWRDQDTFSTAASFIGAPAGLPPFTVATAMDDVVLDIGAGVDVIDSAGFAMRAQYDGRFGSDTRQSSISLKGSVPF